MHAQLGKRLGDVGALYSSIFALRTFPSGLATASETIEDILCMLL